MASYNKTETYSDENISIVKLQNELSDLYKKTFPDGKAEIFSVAPGRVNLIGDHTDYNSGFVLPITTVHGVFCILGKSGQQKSKIYSVNFEEMHEFEISNLETKKNNGSWIVYLQGIIQELKKRFTIEDEINCILYGNVPIGAGLSSSAATEISFANGFTELLNLDISDIDVIKLCQHVEINYAGVECGIMDQFVSSKGKKDHALFLDCETLDINNIPIHFNDKVLVITDSKVKRELASSVYNTRANECRQSLKILQNRGFNINSLSDLTISDLTELKTILSYTLYNRIKHVITENKRVNDSVAAIINDDLIRLGELMRESHQSLKIDFEVSCAELDFLVSASDKYPHVLGSRMTGGGFGGALISIVEATGVDDYIKYISELYFDKYEIKTDHYIVNDNLESSTSLLV